VNMDLVRTAERLRAHPWVIDARCGHASDNAPGLVLALNSTGIEALCSLGRSRLIEQLQRDAGYTGKPLAWRLLDALPPVADACQIDAWLQAPLPRDAALLGEQQQQGRYTLELRVPLDLVYFPGHFPHAPVVPGAVQIAWALAYASTRLGTPARCQVMEALKFQRLLRPGDRADLTLHHDEARNKLHFAYRDGDKAYSSGRLAWSATA
jgi:3-hydroxymyristoyl/3-hydroxydecanoyl-(acyl carrier protein) dehydratase